MLTRPALGQTASLGELYDARTDKFTTVSLFTQHPPPSAITTTDNNGSDIKYAHTDSYKEKFHHLDINQQLSASFLAGLITVDGSGRYLTSRRDTKLTVQSSLIYNITTVNEKINFQSQELEQCLAMHTLDADIGTHVVSGINWGSRNIVTVKQAVSHEDNASLMAGKLNNQLSLFQSLGFGSRGEFTKANAQRPFDNSFEVSVEGDVVATDGSVPTDLASAATFISNVKKYVDASNSGKGKQLSYTLLPLSDLSRLLKVQIVREITIHSLSSHCAEKFVQAFDEIASALQDLNDHRSLLQSHRDYVSPNDLQAQYAETLCDVRAARKDESALWDVLNEFDVSETSLRQATKSDFRTTKEKLRLIAGLVDKGAKYIGFNGKSFDLELGQIPDTDIFVFRFSEAARDRSKEWAQNVSILHQLFREQGSLRILLHDCDAMEEALDKTKISLYRNAEIITEDILEERQISASKPTARYVRAHLDRSGAPKPLNRLLVSLPCPSENCSTRAKHDWICSKCGCQIEYGRIDQYIYCNCGRCNYKYWDFRCPGRRHGLDFSRYDNTRLFGLLDDLEPFEECNILILGRTGVGKSTWINALANYLTYPTLDDALAADSLSWVIPFAFETNRANEDGEYEAIKVEVGFPTHSADTAATKKVGVDEHDGSTCQSATQRTVVHRVQIGNCEIRLIDTPGIGDTRGASQDKQNMADILSVLRSYPKLHGIMILLKPNDQKLDLTFKFCLQELLTHLHRDAASNIAFGFTNTRGTNYNPGDSFAPLRKLLQKFSEIDIGLHKRNVYCFDSESLRYLAAYKQQNIALGPLDENRRSWEYSVGESKRLLEYFQGLKPHQVTSTVNLYETRVRIVKMTEPMAMIAQTIKSSIAVNEDEMNQLAGSRKSREELEKTLKVKVSTLVPSPVEKPRTTCHHTDCIEHANTGSLGLDGKQVLKTVYKTMCHRPCYLSGIKVEDVGNAGLRDCWAMVGDTCRICNHSWTYHLHINYEQIEETIEVDDPTVLALLQENASFTETKQAAIEAKKRLIEELEHELQEFTLAAAQFSNFLKRNAIMPYNDATVDYIDRTIEDEKEKVAVGGSSDKLQRLRQYRKEYEQEIRTLNEQMVEGEKSKLLNRVGVGKLVQKLHSLPHYGQTLRNIEDVVDKGQSFEHRERPVVMRARPHFTREEGPIKTASSSKATGKGTDKTQREDVDEVKPSFWRRPWSALTSWRG